MPELTVYDPPMCCSTGVCGPDGDDLLARFAGDLDWASRNGARVARYNLAQQPGAFAENQMIRSLLEKDGMDCLPLVVFDGDVIAKGGYPTRDELAVRLGLATPQQAAGAEANPVNEARCCSSARPAG